MLITATYCEQIFKKVGSNIRKKTDRKLNFFQLLKGIQRLKICWLLWVVLVMKMETFLMPKSFIICNNCSVCIPFSNRK